MGLVRRRGPKTHWPYLDFRKGESFKREPSRRKRREEPPRTSAEEPRSDKLAQVSSRSQKLKKHKNKDKKNKNKKKKRGVDKTDADPLELMFLESPEKKERKPVKPRKIRSGQNLPSAGSQPKEEGRHTFIINLEPRVECDFCDEKFMTFQERSQHYTNHHQVNVDWDTLSEKTRH